MWRSEDAYGSTWELVARFVQIRLTTNDDARIRKTCRCISSKTGRSKEETSKADPRNVSKYSCQTLTKSLKIASSPIHGHCFKNKQTVICNK